MNFSSFALPFPLPLLLLHSERWRGVPSRPRAPALTLRAGNPGHRGLHRGVPGPASQPGAPGACLAAQPLHGSRGLPWYTRTREGHARGHPDHGPHRCVVAPPRPARAPHGRPRTAAHRRVGCHAPGNAQRRQGLAGHRLGSRPGRARPTVCPHPRSCPISETRSKLDPLLTDEVVGEMTPRPTRAHACAGRTTAQGLKGLVWEPLRDRHRLRGAFFVCTNRACPHEQSRSPTERSLDAPRRPRRSCPNRAPSGVLTLARQVSRAAGPRAVARCWRRRSTRLRPSSRPWTVCPQPAAPHVRTFEHLNI